MKVLVTGAAGFLGQVVVQAALERGWGVHAIDRPDAKHRPRTRGDLTFEAIDLRDRLHAPRLAALHFDAIIHLAGILPGAPNVMEDDAARINFDMANVALEVARLAGGRRIVLAGSSAEYGTAQGVIDESVPAAPSSSYGRAKWAATSAALTLTGAGLVDAIVLRPFLIYGPGQRGDMFVPAAVRACELGEPFEMSEGKQERDFVFVRDVAAAFLSACIAPASARVINIASGIPVRLLDVARAIEGAFGRCGLLRPGARPYRPGEPMRVVGSPALAERVLGWRATTDLAEGLRETVQAAG